MKGDLACLQQTRSAERLPQIVTVFCSWKPQNKKSTKVSYNLNICNKFVIYERQVPILHIFFHLSTKCVKKERKTYIWYPLVLYLVCFWKEIGIVSSERKCKNLLKLHAMGLGILVAVIKNIDFIAIYRGTHIFNCVDNAIYHKLRTNRKEIQISRKRVLCLCLLYTSRCV